MQTDAEPFLQRIRAFPDDDVPRLIFADWLDEQASALPPRERIAARDRAEFIRLQIALARLPDDEPRRANLVVAERALHEIYADEWTAPFRRVATGPVFHRGFVDEVNVDARNYLRHAHELFSAGPIRHIHLLNVGGSLNTVMQSAYLSRLSDLTVYAAYAGEPLARALARSEHLANLRGLFLGRNRFGDDAIEYLAGSPIHSNLEELDLSENDLGETGARALAASPHLGKLRRLELRRNQLGPAGAEAVASSERLTSLHRLGLADNEIGTPRLLSLTRVGELLRIPVLDLHGNGLSAAGLRAILAKPPVAGVRLRELDLSHNDLGDAGVRVLAESPHVSELTVLRLAGCAVGDEGARALATSPHLNRLVDLDLGNNPVSDAGFRAFLESPYLKSLRPPIIPGIGVSRQMRLALDMRFLRRRA